jgi:hydroxymethylbilane synthase
LLVIGSRGSKLALWQANHIKDRLGSLGHECRIEIIRTTGDTFQSGPLKEIGNKGLFTKEIEEALLDGRIDVAVHSLKDMPTDLPDGLQITATPEREDARDVMIGATLEELRPGSKIGTGSLRRIAQLAAVRPDVTVQPVRGNVDTRLRKLDDGQFDAIVLAAAGLNRLGLAHRIAEYLAVDIMCPAVGQGALAIETRKDNGDALHACLRLDDPATHACITAERAVLAKLGGGCQVPVGAHATISDGRLTIRTVVISTGGDTLVRHEESGAIADAEAIGARAGNALLDRGAREILTSVYGSPR